MSTYYVIGEEATIHGTNQKAFSTYDCTPEFHTTLEAAQDDYDDWFSNGEAPKSVGIWKIERIEP